MKTVADFGKIVYAHEHAINQIHEYASSLGTCWEHTGQATTSMAPLMRLQGGC